MKNFSRSSRFSTLIIIGLFLLGCKKENPVIQQHYSPEEFLVRETRIGDSTFKYRVYVPANRKNNEILPIMLYLHGAGNRGNDNESQLNGLAEEIRASREKFSFIVVVPQCEADGFWDAKTLDKTNKALDETVSALNGDPKRIYLAGFSLGGYAVWSMAAMFPNKFTAIVPMSGRALPRSSETKNVSPEIAKLAGDTDPYRAFAEKIGMVSVWIFHGSNDKVVPVDSSRRMDTALRNTGNFNVKYTEVEGAGHEPLGFRTPELFQWLGEQKLQ